MSVEHVQGVEYTFEVNFSEEGLKYRVDFKGEELRVNYVKFSCDRFSYKDLLNYHLRLGLHDVFIVFCQPSPEALETVKFIIDGKPVYYEIPGQLTVWLEDSGEIASLHTGDDPGDLVLTSEERFMLAAHSTKHSQKITAARKGNPRKTGIPVPDTMLVEKDSGKLIISWPKYNGSIRKKIAVGIALIILSLVLLFNLSRYMGVDLSIYLAAFLFVPGYLLLKKAFDRNMIIIEGKDLEVRHGFRGSKIINAVYLGDVEKFELHKDGNEQNYAREPQLCALKKSGEHVTLLSSQLEEVFAYLESKLNLVLHQSEHEPPQ